jgi:peptide/nickel transport system substrate-binding protein
VTPAVQSLQKVLQDRARELVAQSDSAKKESKGNLALVLLEEAERTWPRLDGLPAKRAAIAKEYPTLRIGVRTLPSQMSPTTAETDSDRLAVRLIFDRLLELRGGPSAREGYAYKLGPEPQTIANGWEFTLPRDIKWSDGKPFTAKDVVRSFEIVKDPRSPYYNPQLNPELAEPIVEIRTLDDYRFTITLKQGHLDPMSFLTFDLVPAHLLLPDRTPRNMAFGKAPVGTGPYIFKGFDGKEAIFVANPNYKRLHCPDGPGIKEIRLVQYDDLQTARQMLTNGTLHLLADFSSKDRESLTGIPRVDLLTPTEPKEPVPPYLSNGRVYWLVPNFRQKAMQNVELRRAISAAIDREKILNDAFRGKDKKFHQVLNGPFPLNSWAYNPEYDPTRQSPYKPDEAKTNAGAAKQALGGSIPTLTLKYPAGDATAAAACQQVEAALKTIDVKLKLEAVPYQQLVAELSGDRPTFDLLYWAHDYDDETLNLWPLFDPQGIGSKGRNFMGFERDSKIEGLFREIQQHRDYAFIRERTQMFHFNTLDKMLLIPLWQIDRHVAVHRNLRPTRLHPVWLVDGIEEWQLRAGE